MQHYPHLRVALIILVLLTLAATADLALPVNVQAATPTDTPTSLNPLANIANLGSAGRRHLCVITREGALLCWGSNNFGQLGDDTMDNRGAPVAVRGLPQAVTIAVAGAGHSCALTTAGAIYCWGGNGNGQLGTGNTEGSTHAILVPTLQSGVIDLAAGRGQNCVIVTGGKAKCWGDNGDGELGDGTNQDRLTPVDVAGLTTGVFKLAGGGDHFCAIMIGGGLKCWGKN